MKIWLSGLISVAMAALLSPSAAASDIFRDAPANPKMTERQRTQLDLVRASDAATGIKVVQAASYAVLQDLLARDADGPGSPSKVALRLGDGAVLTAARTSIAEYAGKSVWRGVVEGGGGRVTLMWWPDGEIAGTVQHDGRYYSIRRISGNLHAIVELSDDRMPPEHPAQILASSDQLGRPQRNRVLNAPLQAKPRKAAPGADVMIDVLIAYTDKAANYYGDIKHELIELAIEEANESFRISNLGNVKLRLVHTYQTEYVEAGDQFEDLWRLADKGDGKMEEVHALRDKYRADVVVLIVDDRHGCGLSTRVHADAEEAFAVVHHECAATTHSIAHEIGHIIGTRHDLNMDKMMTPFPYGHGYVNGTKWRDIMSYKESCGGCRRVPIWSSPLVMFEGEPAGTPDQDNGRVIAEEAPRVAAFR
jgi:metallopeptidase family M12-like protein